MNGFRPGPVVVGVDGSQNGRPAADHAAWEASRRRLPLRLVHGVDPPSPYYATGPAGVEVPVQDRQAMLIAEMTRILGRYPEVETATQVIMGGPSAVLVEESKMASMLVVGKRGAGGFADLPIGSVAAQVAAHAQAPVIIIPPVVDERRAEVPNLGPVAIVVGIDGFIGSTVALDFAFEEAEARGSDLVAIYTWGVIERRDPTTPAQERPLADHVLDEALAGYDEQFPGVRIQRRIIHSPAPAYTLVDHNGDAALIVVGPPRAGLASPLIGSISDGLVRHSPVPVAVVHAYLDD